MLFLIIICSKNEYFRLVVTKCKCTNLKLLISLMQNYCQTFLGRAKTMKCIGDNDRKHKVYEVCIK